MKRKQNMKKNKIMDFFSALGRSLMMPIATLAACGIVLGLTAALLKPQVVQALPFLQVTGINFLITTQNPNYSHSKPKI